MKPSNSARKKRIVTEERTDYEYEPNTRHLINEYFAKEFFGGATLEYTYLFRAQIKSVVSHEKLTS